MKKGMNQRHCPCVHTVLVQHSFDYVGTASRECNEDATWAETDVTGCQSRQFMELTFSVSMLKIYL